MRVSREQLAWAAGFFDGEGCTFAARQGRARKDGFRSYYPIIQVGQVDLTNLERFKQIVGIGNIAGPYKQEKSPRGVYKYKVSGFARCQALIAMMWLWLGIPKREQAKRALGLYCDQDIKGRRSKAR